MAKSKSVLPQAQKDVLLTHHWHNEEFAARYPGLFEFFAQAIVNAASRKGGSISLFCHAGKLKANFLDKETQMHFWADLKPGFELLDELEAILTGDHEPWTSVKKEAGKIPF